MKILIIGAGAVASVIARFLSKEKTIETIVCASRDLKKARQFIVPGKKISLRRLDASETRDVAEAAGGCDLIINASLPNFNENILEAALLAGTNYQDLCSHLLNLKTPEQLKFHQRFRRAGLVGLINAGVSPGITNLLAREAADRLDSVTEINIRTLEEQHLAGDSVSSWSPEVAADELTSPPLVYTNGRFRLVKPFGNSEDFDFPPPFGRRRLADIYGDEVSTIPRYINTKSVSYKSGGSDLEVARRRIELARSNSKIHFPPTPTPKQVIRLVRNGRIVNAFFLSVVEVVGKKSGRKVKIRSVARYPDIKRISRIFPGATSISYPTGAAAAAFAVSLPKIKYGGIYPPEALPPAIRRDILRRLKLSGAVLETRTSAA